MKKYLLICALFLSTFIMNGCCGGEAFLADLVTGITNVSTSINSNGSPTPQSVTVSIISEVINLIFEGGCAEDYRETSSESYLGTSVYYEVEDGGWDPVGCGICDNNGTVLRLTPELEENERIVYSNSDPSSSNPLINMEVEYAGIYRIVGIADYTNLVNEGASENNNTSPAEYAMPGGRVIAHEEGTIIHLSKEDFPFLKEWTGEGAPPVKMTLGSNN